MQDVTDPLVDVNHLVDPELMLAPVTYRFSYEAGQGSGAIVTFNQVPHEYRPLADSIAKESFAQGIQNLSGNFDEKARGFQIQKGGHIVEINGYHAPERIKELLGLLK